MLILCPSLIENEICFGDGEGWDWIGSGSVDDMLYGIQLVSLFSMGTKSVLVVRSNNFFDSSIFISSRQLTISKTNFCYSDLIVGNFKNSNSTVKVFSFS